MRRQAVLHCVAKRNNEEIKGYRQRFILRHGKDPLNQLQRQIPLKSILAFLSDWILILGACTLVGVSSIYWLPLSLLIIGSRQRGFSNLVHDGAHGNLFRSRKINDGIANWLAAYPMLDTVGSYRTLHAKHHRYLGSSVDDPDSVNHFRYGYDDQSPPQLTGSSLYLKLLFNLQAWKDSFLGGFKDLSALEQVRILTWWVLILSACAVFGLGKVAACFTVLWVSARATTYHAIRIFAEFLDHAGLKLNSITSFSRNLPHSGVLTALFHPHQDTFHLIHHLFPLVPHYHLSTMNHLLQGDDDYRLAHHCDSYFSGSHPAIRCWVGKCGEVKFS